MINVIALKAIGNGTLVEWRAADGLHRAVVPHEDVVSGRVDDDALAAGIPYGVAWEDMIEIDVTPGEMAAALRQAGIWTMDDLRKNPSAAVNALQRVYGIHLSALSRLAVEYEKSGG